MTYLVPFEGSPLSVAALTKARLHATALEQCSPDLKGEVLPQGLIDLVAVTVIPDSPIYAREMGWIDEGEEFRARGVIGALHEQVTKIAPGASFQSVRADGAARAGTIAKRLRQKAEEIEASVVFMGSENAGRIVTPVASVAGPVAAGQAYDLHIVRRPLPPDVQARLSSETPALHLDR